MIRSKRAKRELKAARRKAAKRAALAKTRASRNKHSSPTYQNSENIPTWVTSNDTFKSYRPDNSTTLDKMAPTQKTGMS